MRLRARGAIDGVAVDYIEEENRDNKQQGQTKEWKTLTAGWHALFATDKQDKLLYQFNADQLQFQRVVDVKVAVKHMACGRNHVLVVDVSGALWSWGADNSCGQLGAGDFDARSSPVRVIVGGEEKGIAKVFAGEKVSACLSGSQLSGSQLFTFGNIPQLGYDVSSEHKNSDNNNSAGQCTPRAIEAWDKNFQVPDAIESVSFGGTFAVALTGDGMLYMWGKAFYLQQGDHNKKDPVFASVRPRLMVELAQQNHKIRRVACGPDHVLMSTSSGKVLSWGANDAGQLGIGSHKPQKDPYLVMKFRNIKVKEIACSPCHSLALDDKGVLYSWGAQGVGEKFSKSIASQLVPAPAKVLANLRVRKFACGEHFSAVLVVDRPEEKFDAFNVKPQLLPSGSATSEPAPLSSSTSSSPSSSSKKPPMMSMSMMLLLSALATGIWAVLYHSFSSSPHVLYK